MPVENVPHWRHKAGDCDPWSESEGPWHLGWKELFDFSCREIGLVDGATGERHRADVLYGGGTSKATVLELQHSPIAEEERSSREAFYRQEHRMFWLVHIHSDHSFLGFNFGSSMDFGKRPIEVDGKTFAVMLPSFRIMVQANTQRQIAHALLTARGIARLMELRDAGVTAATVSRMERDGEVLRLARGLYQLADAPLDANHSLAETTKRGSVSSVVRPYLEALTANG